MATIISQGAVGENVAQIQRWIAYMLKQLKIPVPAGFIVNATYDAATTTAMKAIQKKLKLSANPSGQWGTTTQKWAAAYAKKVSGGKSTNAFWPVRNLRSITDDRKYITEQWQYLFGRPPTAAELDFRVSQLQSGMTRSHWIGAMEKYDAEASVTRIFKEKLGREPTASELTTWANQLKNQTATRKTMGEYLAGTHEAITKAEEEALSEGAEDQQAILNRLLEDYGLGDLKEWAWEQIKTGASDERILQNLRDTESYKERFAGMAARTAQGKVAISESEYLDYERQAAQMMKRYGLPPGFYDDPADYAALIGSDISLDELNSRIVEGYTRVTNAPIEVRQAFAEMYGMDGDAALTAAFIDPDRAEQALLKQARSAEAKGWGGLFGIDFSNPEAETLGGIEMSTDQLRQGLADLSTLNPLFTESVSEDEDMRAGEQGIEAVFNTGGTGANELDERRRERLAAVSGGGGANITQQGLGVGAAD